MSEIATSHRSGFITVIQLDLHVFCDVSLIGLGSLYSSPTTSLYYLQHLNLGWRFGAFCHTVLGGTSSLGLRGAFSSQTLILGQREQRCISGLVEGTSFPPINIYNIQTFTFSTGIYGQRRPGSACASTQSDQDLRCWLTRLPFKAISTTVAGDILFLLFPEKIRLGISCE